MTRELHLVSTCPDSRSVEPERYLDRVRTTARWCEAAGHDGLLVLSGHHLCDPWTVAQAVLAEVDCLRPVITVQPLEMHPYSAARRLVALGQLYGRAPDVVLAAGGSRRELATLGDTTRHDQRYERLVEYGTVLQQLLASDTPLRHEGAFYRIDEAEPLPRLDPGRRPRYFVAASSEAGSRAGAALGAIPVTPYAPHAAPTVPSGDHALRVGIIGRPLPGEAELEAEDRFPEVRGLAVEHRLGMMGSDARWHRQLEQLGADVDGDPGSVWMQPFQHGYSQVPYLVGDYRTVSRQLLPALQAGANWLFVDTPGCEADLAHLDEVVRRAWRRTLSPLALTG